MNSINYIEILSINYIENFVLMKNLHLQNTVKHVPLNDVVLVTLEKEVEGVFNFTTVTRGIFNYVFWVDMET